MSGNKFSKIIWHRLVKVSRGQVLLVTIMLLATVLTVVLSISFTSNTESQIAQLEAETHKALAAAEAGVEAVLKQDGANVLELNTLNLGEGINGVAEITNAIDNEFVSPIIQKDEEYSFYLCNYDSSQTGLNNVFTNPSTNNLRIYFGSGSSYNCAARTTPALELIFISSNIDNPTITKKIIDPCSSGQIIGAIDNIATTNGGSFMGNNFTYRTSTFVETPPNSYFMIARVLFASTKIGIEGLNQLKVQGKTIVSTASTGTGTTKKVQLFQSYPQIPADFFITAF